jgi:hypothetical protein
MICLRGFVCNSALILLAAVCLLRQTSAAPLVFTINSSQSSVTISGTVAGAVFTAQGPGSLTTSYRGTINANLTNSTLQFTGGSSIDAETNGIWEPAVGGGTGSAPADYGATNSVNLSIGPPKAFPGNAALRNIVLDLTSPVLTLTNDDFAGNNLVFTFITNTASLDYNYTDGGAVVYEGTTGLNGYSTNTLVNVATISTNANVRTLTIPINAQYQFTLISENDSSLELTGQLVATNALPLPPFIQSIVKSGQNIVVTTENTTAQSLLLTSTNLSSWTTASSTITTNGLGMIVFTAPISGPHAFYRVQQ